MEVSNLRILGSDNAVLFTGRYYIVHNNFFSLVAIAERSQEDDKHFVISVGSSQCIGSRYTNNVLFSKVKAFIKKSEARNTHNVCTCEMQEEDLNRFYLKINLCKY